MDSKVILEHEVEALLDEAYQTRVNNLPRSISLAMRAVKLTEHTAPHLTARANNLLALFYMIKGEFREALELAQIALTFFEKVHDPKGVADAKYTIGSVFYKTNNYPQGLQMMLDCLRLYRRLEDHHNEARVLKSIGTIYEYFGDQTNAVDSYNKCIEAAKKAGDLNQVSNAYNPLSGIYLEQGKTDLAMSTIQESIAIKEKTKDLRGHAYALYGRGKVHYTIGNLLEAMNDFKDALSIHEQMGDQLGIGMVLNKLGLTCIALKYFSAAEKFLHRAIEVAERCNILFIQFKAQYHLHTLFLARQDTRNALACLQKYIELKETVINTHTHNIIQSYESIKKIETLEYEAKAQREKAAIIERKNNELDSFFYRISHDLKGPISSLIGLNSLVKLEVSDETALRYFELYHSQILRVNNIVIDLINLTRMKHGSGMLSEIDFRVLTEDCIASYHYVEHFKKIKFVLNIEEDIGYVSEWAIVNTILQNLIENAIKYQRMDPEPFVGITISKDGAFVRIQVEDNGQGIRPEDQSRIFDMFFRANDRAQGTGLGLYILKRAVERLNGDISLKSELHKGSTFTIRLPLHVDRD